MQEVECRMHFADGKLLPKKVEVTCNIDSGCYRSADQNLLRQTFVIAGETVVCPEKVGCYLYRKEDYTNKGSGQDFTVVRVKKYEPKSVSE